MTNPIHFEIQRPAIGWARARTSGKRFFTDDRTRAEKEHIGIKAREAMRGHAVAAGPVTVRIIAQYRPPKSWPKWRQAFAADHQCPKPTKPDADNIAKLVADGMNGIVFVDDAQIATCSVTKRYGHEDRIIVLIEDAFSIPERRSDAA